MCKGSRLKLCLGSQTRYHAVTLFRATLLGHHHKCRTCAHLHNFVNRHHCNSSGRRVSTTMTCVELTLLSLVLGKEEGLNQALLAGDIPGLKSPKRWHSRDVRSQTVSRLWKILLRGHCGFIRFDRIQVRAVTKSYAHSRKKIFTVAKYNILWTSSFITTPGTSPVNLNARSII